MELNDLKHDAVSRVKFELNLDIVPYPTFSLAKSLVLVDKVLYKAYSDEEWGEYELDYILFVRQPELKEFKPNFDEVVDIKWVSPGELEEFVERNKQ